jgi:CRISPR-associated protein Cst2
MTMHRNLFATVLTNAAPSSNYRGESEENRTVIQKITRGGQEHAVISPEAMRNALRDILATRGAPTNRRRLHEEGQLAVEFKEIPNAAKFADDFLFGYMVADPDKVEGWPKSHPSKRDSVLRMNMAVALQPYRYNATFHQSPLNAGESPWKNADRIQLLHREVTWTAFQYPFALAGADVAQGKGKEWARMLLAAIGELNGVAGGHARSYFEMAPRSIVARLTTSLVAGYSTYGFDVEGNFPELERLGPDDLPASEFWIGGEIVRRMPEERRTKLRDMGAKLHDNPQKLLEGLVAEAF